jgi:hypothetical protein
MKLREQLEIAMPGSSSWMPYAPQGVKGLDDDDDDRPGDYICMVAPNVCGSSVRNLLHVTVPAPRIKR